MDKETVAACTLRDEELIEKVNALTAQMYKTGNVPATHILPRPNEDYHILVAELCKRLKRRSKVKKTVEKPPAVKRTYEEHVRKGFEEMGVHFGQYEDELYSILRYHMSQVQVTFKVSSGSGVVDYYGEMTICGERYVSGGKNLWKRYRDFVNILNRRFGENLYRYNTLPLYP